MNVHTCVTDNTTYSISMSDQYVWLNDECTHMCYWYHSLHHGICQMHIFYLKMKVHICDTENTNYTMVYVRSLCLN